VRMCVCVWVCVFGCVCVCVCVCVCALTYSGYAQSDVQEKRQGSSKDFEVSRLNKIIQGMKHGTRRWGGREKELA
jgi:hypothetical protein